VAALASNASAAFLDERVPRLSGLPLVFLEDRTRISSGLERRAPSRGVTDGPSTRVTYSTNKPYTPHHSAIYISAIHTRPYDARLMDALPRCATRLAELADLVLRSDARAFVKDSS